MENLGKVSIIIPTYRRHDFIGNTIKNVLRQDYPNFEILIIDDNGRNTQNQICTFEAIKALISQNDNIRYICQEENSGVCCARNRGIQEANGQFVAFLDDDDFWHPSYLSEILLTIKNTNAGIVYANFYRLNEIGFFYNKKEKYYSGSINNALLEGWCPATTSLFCIKKNLLMEYGCFDEHLKNLEEYDLWIRLSEKNEFAFCNKRLVVKNESIHEQLTTNHTSRIQAWKSLKEKWSTRELCPEQKNKFFNIIENNIRTDSYLRTLQNVKDIQIPRVSKYGIIRTSFLYMGKLFGVSFVAKIKRKISRLTGTLTYLSKSEELDIRHTFNISIDKK